MNRVQGNRTIVMASTSPMPVPMLSPISVLSTVALKELQKNSAA